MFCACHLPPQAHNCRGARELNEVDEAAARLAATTLNGNAPPQKKGKVCECKGERHPQTCSCNAPADKKFKKDGTLKSTIHACRLHPRTAFPPPAARQS